MLKHFVAGLLIAHGAIHAMGFVWAWDLAEIEELGGPTLLFTGHLQGDPAVAVLGGVWLLATITLIAAGVAVARGSARSLPLTGFAASVSLVVTVIWWSDARIGAIVSALILLAVITRRIRHDTPEPVAQPTAGILDPQLWRSTL